MRVSISRRLETQRWGWRSTILQKRVPLLTGALRHRERGGGRVGGCGEWKTAEVVRGRVTRRRPRSGSTWLDRRDSNRPEREKGGRAEESREKRVIEGISHLPSNQRIDDQSKTNYHPRGVSKTSRLAVGVEGIRSVLEFVSRIGKERRSDFFRTILFLLLQRGYIRLFLRPAYRRASTTTAA